MRRLLMAACVAVFLAVVVQAIPVDVCRYLTPGSYWYEVFGCGPAGGGASGASLP